MANIQAILDVNKVMTKLRARAAAAVKDGHASCVVGYTQSYALWVHENLEAQHKEGKQAKYLEAPARRLASSKVFSGIIVTAMRAGKTLGQALLLCGLRLQRESQQIVPIDTGALKNSAFTSLEQGA